MLWILYKLTPASLLKYHWKSRTYAYEKGTRVGLKQGSTREPETEGRQDHFHQADIIIHMYVYPSPNTKQTGYVM